MNKRWIYRILSAVVLIVAAFLIYYFGSVYATEKKVSQILNLSQEALTQSFEQHNFQTLSGNDVYLLAAFAQNKNSSPEVLDQIARMQDPELVEPLTTVFLSLKGENQDGVSVKQLVARNPNVDTKTLAYLASSKNIPILCEVARNPRTLIFTLETLARSKNQRVKACVKDNKNLPAPLKKKLLSSLV